MMSVGKGAMIMVGAMPSVKSLASKKTDTLLRSLDKIEHGSFEIELPNGKSYFFDGSRPGPEAHLKLNDNSVINNVILKGDVGLADDYRLGRWESKDIAALVECGLLNDSQFKKFVIGKSYRRVFDQLLYLLRRNTRKGSKRNIHAHYDLGNDFYRLWLDESMTYSSALFHDQSESLSDAQRNKYDRILDCLEYSQGQVLEIGCGWGGFMERAIEREGHDMTGVTISAAQHDFATQRLSDKGANAQVQLQDYRDLKGKFDGIVSIEMFEAVGERYWKAYFTKMKSLLANSGKAVIQTITMDDAHFDAYRKGGDAIRSYIFPGGMLPSPSRFHQEAERAGLQVVGSHAFGQDYAKTLRMWLQKFDEKRDEIKAQGFDESFMRLWRYYLASCAGSFSAGRIDVMQVELAHA